jgi:hypothetical protein
VESMNRVSHGNVNILAHLRNEGPPERAIRTAGRGRACEQLTKKQVAREGDRFLQLCRHSELDSVR